MKNLQIKKHILTSISYMIPLVVAAGLCMAIGQMINADVRTATDGLGFYLFKAGGFGMSLIVPVITAGVAYSISDRPGIMPGLITGVVTYNMNAGFIGGIVIGFVIGYIVNFIKTWKVPMWMEGLMPVMIIPVITTAIAVVLMYTCIGIPFAWLQETLTVFLQSMSNGSKFVFGAILGGMACFDFGGPVNKTMATFVNALMVDGIYGPESVKFVGSMIPPFGIAVSCLLTPKKFTSAEKEQMKVAVPMGFCMITEGVIPIAARDLFRVVFSCVVGSAIAGGLCMIWGTGAPVPHGGMLSVPLFTNPLGFCAALAIGSVITGVILSVIKKPVTEADELAGLDDLGKGLDESDSSELVIENL